MLRGARSIYLDPDFRPRPKTDCYCCICQRDIRGSYRKAYVVASGFAAIHPDDLAIYSPGHPDDEHGWMPIGPDCAARLGLQWTVANT